MMLWYLYDVEGGAELGAGHGAVGHAHDGPVVAAGPPHLPRPEPVVARISDGPNRSWPESVMARIGHGPNQ